MIRSFGVRYALLCAWLLVLFGAGRAAALTPDEIALVVNAKAPIGLELAQLYAKERGIPDGRIITLDLPTGDDISYADYGPRVLPGVRRFLVEKQLDKKVTCLVTFRGVPLRVSRKPAAPAGNEEIRLIDTDMKPLTDSAAAIVTAAEAIAKEAAADYKHSGEGDLQSLLNRLLTAERATILALQKNPEAEKRGEIAERLLAQIESAFGPFDAANRRLSQPYQQLGAKPIPPDQLNDLRQKIAAVNQEMTTLNGKIDDPKVRERFREVAKSFGGTFGRLNVLNEMKNRLRSDETEAAFDSELSLLWWADNYIRYRWQPNALNVKERVPRATSQPGASAGFRRPITAEGRPAVLMVMRIDAPTEQLARDLITTSVRIEKEGLTGRVALDARGKPANDAYGSYDQTIRNLADLLKNKTKLDVVLDNAEPVFQPGSVKDVALYCGWYSLRKYIPGMVFRPGAVGFHVASSELVALHPAKETGWVHGLMTDGVVASLGPVAEPYLHSFPPADEFFPLLLTGKLALAEVYWYTNPLTSWMNTCIGDPLYRPYAKDPPLKIEDLPPKLRPAVQ